MDSKWQAYFQVQCGTGVDAGKLNAHLWRSLATALHSDFDTPRRSAIRSFNIIITTLIYDPPFFSVPFREFENISRVAAKP
ncbi:hypothetical protein RRF57_007343 [Xylaria bambusicola]|uniref:Uncharacterized protein n=1 Tax=Xylaria bambusicola TaxID=326684 RepID=A0AAN7UQD8_9PEZI